MTIGEFAEAVAMYGMLTDASVTSWGRSTARNTAVGGVKFSSHRFWRGCDVVYDTAISEADRSVMALRLGLKLIAEGDHDHLQPADWSAG